MSAWVCPVSRCVDTRDSQTAQHRSIAISKSPSPNGPFSNIDAAGTESAATAVSSSFSRIRQKTLELVCIPPPPFPSLSRIMLIESGEGTIRVLSPCCSSETSKQYHHHHYYHQVEILSSSIKGLLLLLREVRLSWMHAPRK